MLMDYRPLSMIFSQKDLYWLDSLMPGAKQKAKEHLRKKHKKRSRFRQISHDSQQISGCCRSRRGRQGQYDVEDNNMAPMKPDIVLKMDDDLEKEQNQVESTITSLERKDQLDNPVSVLEPLLDNNIVTGEESQQSTTQ